MFTGFLILVKWSFYASFFTVLVSFSAFLVTYRFTHQKFNNLLIVNMFGI